MYIFVLTKATFYCINLSPQYIDMRRELRKRYIESQTDSLELVLLMLSKLPPTLMVNMPLLFLGHVLS